jgi:hypothetical protein
LGVVAAGSVMAAPRIDFSTFTSATPYPVRFVLPDARSGADQAPGTNGGSLARIAEAVEPNSAEVSTPMAEASPPALAVVSEIPVTLAVKRSPPRNKLPGMIALHYSLTGGAEAGDAIEVDKPVMIAGADAGRVPLRIDGNARVYAQGKRLAALIAAKSGEKAVPEGLSDEFLSLETLRALGIGIRYDPVRDRLVLDPPAA